ncbi:hypothetical protein AX774_g320 [Zancudomyces culisetae]|uniref:Uncharacterized protein n=1 Tax=Zancudomyces culisetae TaxID=1213189 RepID=A0A1R1PYT4_ZANCU|nr:hypothetical protein AX774_g320 [Zancudomyces culisetae]|eukprot:OMH86091.1 hypothetical protein AX774_g320 [Zancudomyces culisetae]
MKLFVFTTILQVLSVAGARTSSKKKTCNFDGNDFEIYIGADSNDMGSVYFRYSFDGTWKNSKWAFKSGNGCWKRDCKISAYSCGEVGNCASSDTTDLPIITFNEDEFYLTINGCKTETYTFESFETEDCDDDRRSIYSCGFSGSYKGKISYK